MILIEKHRQSEYIEMQISQISLNYAQKDSNTVDSRYNVPLDSTYTKFCPNYKKTFKIYTRYNVRLGRSLRGTLYRESTVLQKLLFWKNYTALC